MTDLRKLAEAARDGDEWSIARWNQGAVTLDHYLALLDERDRLRVALTRIAVQPCDCRGDGTDPACPAQIASDALNPPGAGT